LSFYNWADEEEKLKFMFQISGRIHHERWINQGVVVDGWKKFLILMKKSSSINKIAEMQKYKFFINLVYVQIPSFFLINLPISRIIGNVQLYILPNDL
jgi:hypothetical protein